MKVVIEKRNEAEGGGYVAYNDTAGKVVLFGTGESIAAAKDDFFNSLHEIEDAYRDEGLEVPDELGENVEFHFSLPSVFEAFPWINVTKVAKILGINPSLMHQYKSGKAYVSEERLAAIEAGLRELGAQLAALRI